MFWVDVQLGQELDLIHRSLSDAQDLDGFECSSDGDLRVLYRHVKGEASTNRLQSRMFAAVRLQMDCCGITAPDTYIYQSWVDGVQHEQAMLRRRTHNCLVLHILCSICI